MTNDNILMTVWRRRLTAILVFALCLGAAWAVIRELPKVYAATTVLRVTATVNGGDWEATQLTRIALQSYAELLEGRTIADATARDLPFETTGGEVAGAISIAPRADSQLLSVTAEGSTPERAQAIADTYSETFVRRARRLNERAGASSSIRIAEGAAASDTPVRPRPYLYLMVAAALAALLAGMAALIRDRTDPRLKMNRGATKLLGLPVIGRIPSRFSFHPRRLVPQLSADPPVKTAFDLLLTELVLASGQRSPLSVALVSSQRGEGKTTCADGLGAAAGRAALASIVVDADLNGGDLSRRLGARDGEGLAEVLVGKRDLEEVIRPAARGPAAVLPTGAREGNGRPSPARLREINERLQSGYDIVIFDTPSLSTSADALLLAATVDAVLVVVDGRRSQQAATMQTIDRLQRAGANIVGAVVDRADRARRLDLDEAELPSATSPGDFDKPAVPAERVNGNGSGPHTADAYAVGRDITRR